ncbi:hypothetical protein GF385_00545 [Candidatus Dependentiae bacterium]|nr:hypothetical protein [Candidatus Dependentiae bacterium]
MSDNNKKKNEDKNENVEKQAQKKLSPEELKQKQEQLLKEFMEKNTKELEVPALSVEFKKEAEKIISELEKAKREIEEKRDSFVQQYKTVEDKLQNLTKEGQIKLNEEDFKKSQASFLKYEKSLEQVLGELTGDITFYSNLIAEKPLKTIKVFKNATDDALLYLDQKLRSTKKHVKKLLKDVRVSYSRYFVGLQEQIRKLDYLSSYLKAAKAKKKK